MSVPAEGHWIAHWIRSLPNPLAPTKCQLPINTAAVRLWVSSAVHSSAERLPGQWQPHLSTQGLCPLIFTTLQADLLLPNTKMLTWSSPCAPNTGTGDSNDLKHQCVNMKQLRIATLCGFTWNLKAANQMKILLYEEEAIMPSPKSAFCAANLFIEGGM